jgi:hypothetical protein
LAARCLFEPEVTEWSMTWFWNLNLIHLLDFYLMLAFLVSTMLRFQQYQAILGLVVAVPGRWPRLIKLVHAHRTVFLTWQTVLPGILALSLSLLNMLACRLIWPQAHLRIGDLSELTFVWPIVATLGALMLGIDIYATCNVGKLDRSLLEGYFDQAEYWLRSWVAPVVHVFTLGRINPRRMVAEEVRVALVSASQLLNQTLWWVTVQVGCRLLFGLSVWTTYALGHF